MFFKHEYEEKEGMSIIAKGLIGILALCFVWIFWIMLSLITDDNIDTTFLDSTTVGYYNEGLVAEKYVDKTIVGNKNYIKVVLDDESTIVLPVTVNEFFKYGEGQ